MTAAGFVGLDPVEFGRSVGDIIREVVDPLKRRIDALEKDRAIDAETIEELAKCLERVDAIEKWADGRSMKFMGKWNRDVDYKNGDVAAHAGSLWVAKRASSETPGTGMDWLKMLTADKRGFTAGDGAHV